MVNIGGKKITGLLFTGANDINTGLQLTTQKSPNTTRYRTKWDWQHQILDKKPLKINLASLESNNMTAEIFGMTASVETNYHIASDEIDRISDVNTIHCTEFKHSTSGDSEQLKE